MGVLEEYREARSRHGRRDILFHLGDRILVGDTDVAAPAVLDVLVVPPRPESTFDETWELESSGPFSSLAEALQAARISGTDTGNPDHVESLRRASLGTRAMHEGDFEWMGNTLTADAEVTLDPTWPEGGHVYAGHRGAADFMRTYLDPWEGPGRFIVERSDRRENISVLKGRHLLRGTESGVEVANELSAVNWLRGPLIERTEFYFSHDAALKAAGWA